DYTRANYLDSLKLLGAMTKKAIFQSGQTAVVTGAALGIGRALAQRFAGMGLNVCLADLPGPDLESAVNEIRGQLSGASGQVVGIAADVSDENQVIGLAAQVVERFGVPHVLVNNAVTRVGKGMDAELAEWHRAIGVNFFGVVNGVRAFLPAMQKAGGDRRIVNVGSKQGITNPPGHPIYNVSKSAVKTYTEVLEHELRTDSAQADRVQAHLLVPGWTTTGKSEPNPGAWLPEQVVDYFLSGLQRNDFYIICPDGEVTEEMDRARIVWAASDITDNRPPLSRWHPDFKDKFNL
ncbi:MAG: SDR family NAD(P)-dependent oxidoreductase, partial [Burkholderiaceae bacterium]